MSTHNIYCGQPVENGKIKVVPSTHTIPSTAYASAKEILDEIINGANATL